MGLYCLPKLREASSAFQRGIVAMRSLDDQALGCTFQVLLLCVPWKISSKLFNGRRSNFTENRVKI